PEALKGNRTLRNYRYREAILDIEMAGFGNEIRSITLDGRPLKNGRVPASLKGKHTVKIVLADKSPGGEVNKRAHVVSPAAPVVTLQDSKLMWHAVAGAVRYKVIRNGKLVAEQVAEVWQIS